MDRQTDRQLDRLNKTFTSKAYKCRLEIIGDQSSEQEMDVNLPANMNIVVKTELNKCLAPTPKPRPLSRPFSCAPRFMPMK